jgi:hypothetical protein
MSAGRVDVTRLMQGSTPEVVRYADGGRLGRAAAGSPAGSADVCG